MKRTNDTDVTINTLAMMPAFLQVNPSVKVFIDFGMGSSRWIYNINNCFQKLGVPRSLALRFFHTVTGADSTASCYGYQKHSWWTSWHDFPKHDNLTNAFIALSNCPSKQTVEHHFQILCEWLVFTYCNVVDSDITYHRYDSFIKSPTTNLRALMPAQSSFLLHVLCSAYQAGWVWGNTESQIHSASYWRMGLDLSQWWAEDPMDAERSHWECPFRFHISNQDLPVPQSSLQAVQMYKREEALSNIL